MTPNTTSAGRARLGLRLVAMLLVASLVAAACGGGGGDDETTNTTLTTEATPTTSATADADSVDESTETTEAPTTSVVAETTEPVVADVLAPLTGLTIDEAIADRPALAAKIDNISLARPQAAATSEAAGNRATSRRPRRARPGEVVFGVMGVSEGVKNRRAVRSAQSSRSAAMRVAVAGCDGD